MSCDPLPPRSGSGDAEALPDLQRAFRAWLDDARSRRAVGVSIGRATSEITEFAFAMRNPVLTGALTSHGDLVVSAEWDGQCWDFLLSEEVRPVTVSGCIVCSLCESEGKHRVFPSVEALWQDHLFRPFEQWINGKLAGAQAVALYRTATGGATWARLIQHGDPGSPAFLVALK
jgi:hypothetical protein